MNLSRLATTILRLEKEPISKVRFAKTIYFVHKELIRIGKAKPSEIEYMRMPLGPVPFGFMTLEQDNPMISISKVFTGLAYNASQYSLQKKRLFQKNIFTEFDNEIREILNRLRIMSTSELVELSHKDTSWKNNVNGMVYTISEEDMATKLPSYRKASIGTSDTDNQLLQASLVKGMIKDIVDESTDLEHPDHDSNTTGNI